MNWTQFLAKLPKKEFIVSFSRSSGPGGQNVNKVNTKATIRLPREKLAGADWLDPPVRAKVLSQDFPYTTKRGDLVISSELTRSQHLNVSDCFEKLAKELSKSAFVPAEASEEAKERWRKLASRENEKRKEMKKRHASKKQDRRV